MKYMLLMYNEETRLSDTERERCYLDSAEFANQLHAKGQYLLAAPLYPTSTATSIRVQQGKRLITDGPFAETREQLAGFFLIDAKNLDEAIDIATRVPAGRWGTVEIRPVIDVPSLPRVDNIRTETTGAAPV
jgi:hypothetical protein